MYSKAQHKKHIVCYSGGHSSAIVAIAVVKKYGKESVILLNHNISTRAEDKDVKRFKKQVSEYLDVPITYANMDGYSELDHLDVAIRENAFTIGTFASCTKNLKTEPFYKYLRDNWSDKKEECVIYYGFDSNETNRIVRRAISLAKDGYKTAYPIAQWEIDIKSTKDIGIEPPLTYSNYKHANCKGCLKGGAQHWYVVYCIDYDVFVKAKEAEEKIGYSIIKGKFLKDIECDFKRMKDLEIEPTEHKNSASFWKEAKDALSGATLFNYEDFPKECECMV